MKNTIKFIILISSLALTGCNPDSALLYKKDGITSSELTLKNTSDFKDNKSSLALGNQKILVVPCVFKGEREFTREMLEVTKKVFFEPNLSKEEQAYFSLKEYYDLSSGHKLNITGEVTSVLEIPYTLEELESEKYLPGVPAAEFIKQYENDSILDDYDTNKDGYIDNIVFLYSTPKTDNNGNFWAWVSNFSIASDKNNPRPFRHMWCGYDFLTSEMYRYDAHTPIHEFGHMLGLRDYYPSDNSYVALGGQNMMDYNILDHDPYTKMLLEWVDPLYYEIPENKEITIDLKPFQGNNQFVLLNNSWNHSVTDEYLLIEYYTPTLLNALDSEKAYISRPKGFSKPGIKIYHVDSRLAKLKDVNGKLEFVSYTETIDDDFYYVIGASNNINDSYTDAKRQGRYKQITLIENKDVNNLQAGYTADDESLFYEGDIFDSTTSNYFPNKNAFNDGEKLNLEIIINSLNDDYANITIKHKGE